MEMDKEKTPNVQGNTPPEEDIYEDMPARDSIVWTENRVLVARLLCSATTAIGEELAAYSPEEIAEQPILTGHQETHDRLSAFLLSTAYAELSNN